MTDLSSPRIASIERADLPSHYPRTVGKNARLGSHGNGPTAQYATIRTDQGATGWGLVRSGDASHDPALVGMAVADVFAPETGVTDERAAPLDLALHDLAGIILGQPVYQLIGAAGKTTVPLYDGAIYMDDLDPESAPRGIEAVLENCAADYQLGHRAFKLKIGRGYRWMPREAGLQRDIEVTRAVHAAFPDCRILVDANNGYDYSVDGFLAFLDGVRDVDLFWIEEPFEENRPALTQLRSSLHERGASTLIADGETAPNVPFLLGLAKDDLLDVLIMDVLSYGFTAWRALMPSLREIGVAASPHTWGFPIKSLYAAQLAAGAGNVVTIEGVIGHAQGVDDSAYTLREGNLHLPDLPGFGLPLPLPLPLPQ
ncbi:MAG: enolase C-terminal domain-like protein [Thermomicrobiales bacterium]